MEVATEACEGRVVSLLEGGYSLEGLSLSALAHVGALVAATGEHGHTAEGSRL